MNEASPPRRLAAILAGDDVGYSRMMAQDEAGTLAAPKRFRAERFDPEVARHGGRVFKLIGDGALVEFPSVVDAVRCAVAVQMEGQAGIVLRIGINLGDVLVDGYDLYGDGVNVAARLEQLAEPGGLCVAGIVADSVANRVEASFSDGGEVRVKNIDRPIRIYSWAPGVAATPTKPSQPAIAVLPFDNMSGDPERRASARTPGRLAGGRGPGGRTEPELRAGADHPRLGADVCGPTAGGRRRPETRPANGPADRPSGVAFPRFRLAFGRGA